MTKVGKHQHFYECIICGKDKDEIEATDLSNPTEPSGEYWSRFPDDVPDVKERGEAQSENQTFSATSTDLEEIVRSVLGYIDDETITDPLVDKAVQDIKNYAATQAKLEAIKELEWVKSRCGKYKGGMYALSPSTLENRINELKEIV